MDCGTVNNPPVEEKKKAKPKKPKIVKK